MTSSVSLNRSPSLSLEQLQSGTALRSSSLSFAGAKSTGTASQPLSSGLGAVEELLGSLTRLGPDTDASFVVLAAQIKQLDQDVNQRVRGLEQVGQLNEALNGEMEKVRNFQKFLKENLNGDKDKEVSLSELYGYVTKQDPDALFRQLVEPLLRDPAEAAKLQAASLSQDDLEKNKSALLNHVIGSDPTLYGELARQFPLEKKEFYRDPCSGEIKEKTIAINGNGKSPDKADFRINSENLDKYEEYLKGQQEELTTGRELATIGLNAVISRKEQITQLLSNILKKESDTRNGIISNMR